mmetsp:Transcript_31969/g.73534  ORF Transcript_31969/g.73534 Transcript_31969/m.73534 type:complete len:89 (-) Transcript_31969:113-379(-)
MNCGPIAATQCKHFASLRSSCISSVAVPVGAQHGKLVLQVVALATDDFGHVDGAQILDVVVVDGQQLVPNQQLPLQRAVVLDGVSDIF